jgi:tRNA pseudouridine38-40 synthase
MGTHFKLRIQYDGGGFAGSQAQSPDKGRTVQGELETALGIIAGELVRIALAGRTDSGVHAWGQVASFSFPERPRLSAPAEVMRAINANLPSDLAVTACEVAPKGFHARFSAKSRAYRYLFWSAPHPAPLLARYSLHVRTNLDWTAMDEAAKLLEGTHNFAAFAGSGMGVPADEGEGDEDKPSTIRTMHLTRIVALPETVNPWLWDAPGDVENGSSGLFALDLVANAFLPQMVRTIVGTLLEVGRGKRTVSSIRELLEAGDRRRSGPTARAHGLCLVRVDY